MLPFILLSGLASLAQCAPATLNTRAALSQDLKILQAFAKSVNPSSNATVLGNWATAGADLCSWTGIVCDDKKSSVIGIDFNQNHFTGSSLSLSGLLNKLTSLTFFHANSNSFTGTVPDLSSLKEFVELDVSNNALTGSFPPAVFTAPKLEFIDLRFNKFEGSLPSKVFTSFKNVDVLFVNDNAFTGSIPSELGSYPGRYLTLANNKFTGSIPSTITKMKNLNEILFLNNQLTGSLPSGLGALTQLTVFDVSDNQLTGSVPEELCAIKTLEILVLSGNKFDGKLGPKCEKAKKAGILTI